MKHRSVNQKELALGEALINNLNNSLKVAATLTELGAKHELTAIEDSWNLHKYHINILEKNIDTKLDIAKAFIVVFTPGLIALIANGNWEYHRLVVMVLILVTLICSTVWLFSLLKKKERIADHYMKAEVDRIKAIMSESEKQMDKAKKLADIAEDTISKLMPASKRGNKK